LNNKFNIVLTAQWNAWLAHLNFPNCFLELYKL